MGILDKTDYAAIGKNGTPDQCLQAFNKASGSHLPTSRGKTESLAAGAVEAFDAGRPENIQTLLSDSKDYDADFLATTLYKLLERSDDQAAVMELAFAKTSERVKKAVLDKVLVRALENDDLLEESFVAILLKSGADANITVDGYA